MAMTKRPSVVMMSKMAMMAAMCTAETMANGNQYRWTARSQISCILASIWETLKFGSVHWSAVVAPCGNSHHEASRDAQCLGR